MSERLERLQKVIAHSGITSRRKAEQMILDGRVKVNHQLVTELGTKVGSDDVVEVDGVPLQKEKNKYILFNKPREVISSVSDDKGRKVVTDFFDHIPERIYPVGRLDYDSSGLLILTNDGEFAHLLMHPKHEISKRYIVRVQGIPTNRDLKQAQSGVRSENDVLKATRIKIQSINRRKKYAILEVVLHEGKYRHIRRMLETLGYQVEKIRREQLGNLSLDNLPAGHFRDLTKQEVHQLKELARR